MRIQDLSKQVWVSVYGNKARSGLTILGIVIGIASVIIMLGIGNGAKAKVEDSIASIGTDLLTVSPGASSDDFGMSMGQGTAETLTAKDAFYIEKYLPFLEGVSEVSSGRVQVVATDGTNTNVSIYGTDADYFPIKDLEIMQGSFFSADNISSLSKVVVLGYTVYTDLYGEENINILGQSVEIDGVKFTILGVTKESGTNSEDNVVYAPITTVQHYLTGSNSLSSIMVKVGDEEKVSITKEMVEQVMRMVHGIKNEDDDDFTVSEPSAFLETASEVTGIFTILLASVAGISLIVGGIGIMNMMLTTVSERTKEIGLRKAIGATEFEVNMQFLTESAFLTLMGGVIGLAIGIAVSELITSLGLITTKVTLSSVVLAVGVSGFIGIVFGYYPARNAARLDPIEALRSE
jgi:putative ABC transport system permease protein